MNNVDGRNLILAAVFATGFTVIEAVFIIDLADVYELPQHNLTIDNHHQSIHGY